MGNCNKCGKESTMLFDDTGEPLCWLCSSKKKVAASTHNPDPEEEKYKDRRAWTRYPVQMHLKFYYGENEKSKIIRHAHTGSTSTP